MIDDGGELALIDVREELIFSQRHLLLARSAPLSRLELIFAQLVSRRATRMVLCDDADGLADRAAAVLARNGYTEVSVLAGGVTAWGAAGFELFSGVNVPSKAFGEYVEHRSGTPSVAAAELEALIRNRADIVVLDSRPFDEYARVSIPTATNVPGAELVLRARDIAPSPDTMVVVNCAGRTRSIIGAQSLINAGVPNKVVALRNGTMGWTLASHTLEHGAGRRGAIGPFATAETNARDVAYRAGVRRVDIDDFAALEAQTSRTLYRFDVRDAEEYTAGHLEGFRHYPGGQLVQEIDMAAPVRGARIVLTDNLGIRADMTASWLAQMGWDAFVLDGGYDRALQAGPQQVLPKPDPAHRYRRPYEGVDATAEKMQAYFDWEYGLVAQLARDGTHGFFVV
jgi:rhodanese-related sulfurtransferase